MATVPPLPQDEAEIVAGLDSSFRSVALTHRRLAIEAGLPFKFISGLRSRSQQAALASLPSRNTPAAAPGTSKHEVGFAYYIASAGVTSDQLGKIGVLGEGLGLGWGGRFAPTPDRNHFESRSARAELAAYRYAKLVAAGLIASSVIVLGVLSEGGKRGN